MNKYNESGISVVSRSRELLADHLAAKLQLAITVCKVSKHHRGIDKLPDLKFARKTYVEAEGFCSRHSVVASEEVSVLMGTLKNQLDKWWAANPEGATGSNEQTKVIDFDKPRFGRRRSRARSRAVRPS
jgi:hypothetical protein